ncbi:MAG: 16S rRNA (cytosine(1402)-N(4))-methyltransferase RsmH [Candidatus Abyssubacteria bacterium]
METSDNFGGDPAHKPVLAEEAVELLACRPGSVVVDATVGGGGHAERILRLIGETGRLIGIDGDERAIDLSRRRIGMHPAVTLVHDNFRNLREIVDRLGVEGLDGVLFDLGLSSLQIEDSQRGFSFTREGPLDMRMDRRQRMTAADIVNTYSESQLAEVIKKYGEEPQARRIARALVRERSRRPIETTARLADIVRRCVATGPRARIDPVTRTFQAIRIEVNSELDNLAEALNEGIALLRQGGRICVISFHSLEDRIVKQTYVRAARGCVCPPEFPQCVCGRKPMLSVLTPKPIRPSSEEVTRNPRSRSARLRAAEKVAAERPI